jgi:hypothetical protein
VVKIYYLQEALVYKWRIVEMEKSKNAGRKGLYYRKKGLNCKEFSKKPIDISSLKCYYKVVAADAMYYKCRLIYLEEIT